MKSIGMNVVIRTDNPQSSPWIGGVAGVAGGQPTAQSLPAPSSAEVRSICLSVRHRDLAQLQMAALLLLDPLQP